MNFRPATTNDIPLLGKLICETMTNWGVVAYGLGSQQRAEQAITNLASFTKNRYSYTLAQILEIDQQPAGILLSFPGKTMQSLKYSLLWQLFKIYPLPDALYVLRWISHGFFYADSLPDEYHIAHLAVVESFRRRGLGKQLLEHAETLALQNGLNKCSLEVGLTNDNARSLYDTCGYTVVDTVSREKLKEKYGIAGIERRVKILKP